MEVLQMTQLYYTSVDAIEVILHWRFSNCQDITGQDKTKTKQIEQTSRKVLRTDKPLTF